MVEFYIPIPDPEGGFLEEQSLRSQEHEQMRLKIRRRVSETLLGLRNGHHISPKIKTEIIEHVSDFIHSGLEARTFESPHHCQQAMRKKLLELLAEAKIVKDPWAQTVHSTGVLSGPNHQKQQQRNTALMNAMEAAKKHPQTMETAVSLTRHMLIHHAPVDQWNANGTRKPAVLTGEQLNDLVVNFFFWVLQNDKRFSKIMQFVLYLSIYWKGYGPKKIHATLCGFQGQSKKRKSEDAAQEEIQVPSPGAIKALYDEGARIFENERTELFAKFLANACMNDQSDEGLIEDYAGMDEARAAYRTHALSGHESAESISRVEQQYFFKPQTSIEKWLADIDIILLQHGNQTARNRKFLSVIRLIDQQVSRGSVRNVSDKFAYLGGTGTKETAREIFNQVIERLVLLDPQKSRTSYLMTWIGALAFKALHRTEQVRIPEYMHNVVSYIYRHPDVTDEEVVARFENQSVSLAAVKRARALLLRKSALSLESPVSPGDEDSRGLQDFLPDENSVVGDEKFADTDILRKIQRALSSLPRRDQIICRARIMDGIPLREVGDAMLGGVTREAVRQMEERLLNGLMGIAGDREETIPSEDPKRRFFDAMKANDNYVIMVDETDFSAWCRQKHISQKQERILRLHLGLSPEIGFRRLESDRIVKYFKQQGKKLYLDDTRRFLRHVKRELWEVLRDIPEEERFLQAALRDDMIASAGSMLHQFATLGRERAWFKARAQI